MTMNDPSVFIQKIRQRFSGLQCTLMEVCGTHTHAIRRAGIHRLLPEGIRLLSGPGCPVCVTGSGYIEQAVQLSHQPHTIVTTFGDLLKVPGNTATLSEARAEGGAIRVVYSPLDALTIARENPDQQVVFLGVGFETTAPVIGLTVFEARERHIPNFSVLPALKILKPALEALLGDPALSLHGLIAPGHLCVIIGEKALAFLPEEYHLPTVITGFRPMEIWLGIATLLDQIQKGNATLQNRYPQVVSWEGNQEAQKLMSEIFVPEDAEWRGLGMVRNSGMGFSESLQQFDARKRFILESIAFEEPSGCQCGQILLGKAEPETCPHFGIGCTPEHAIGPCMVSSEGTCAAHYYNR